MTGIPADVNFSTVARWAPSNFTAIAPASLKNRVDVASACSGEVSYDPKGRSATTIARLDPRTTARVSGIKSSTVTAMVFSSPRKLFPALSPTSSTGMPASSNIDAVICS